ncbi:MAG: Rieske (2Fe-2S) protein [Bryobacteraceae bacterium]
MNPNHGEDASGAGRRKFFARLSIGAGAFGALLVAFPVAGFLIAPLLRGIKERWRPVGPVSNFKVAETVEVSYEDASPLPWAGVTGKTAAWLRRDSDTQFTAFSVNCTHLGCPVRWISDANLFMCPCHGGVYYSNGNVAAGPPPHPLTQYSVRVRNGNVEILTGPTPIT